MKTLKIGSYSTGTMRVQDLVPTFMDALDDVDYNRSAELEKEFNLLWPSEGWNAEEWNEQQLEQANHLLEELFDALGERCPPYCTFGASEGDGADYGCWPDVDSLQEDVGDGYVINYNSLKQPSVGELVCNTNDHGNVSLYRVKVALELEEVWAIV